MTNGVRLQSEKVRQKMTYHSETDDALQIDRLQEVIAHISGASVILKRVDGPEISGLASSQGGIRNVERIR